MSGTRFPTLAPMLSALGICAYGLHGRQRACRKLFLSVGLVLAVTFTMVTLNVAHGHEEPPGGNPTGVTKTGSTAGSITLSWTALADATTYETSYKKSAAVSWSEGSSNSVSGTSKTFSNLKPSTSYDFKVRARHCHTIGGERYCWNTAYSSVYTASTSGLSAVAGLSATSSSPNSITLIWNAASSLGGLRVDYYYASFRRSGAATWGGSSSTTGRSKSFSGLQPNQSYEFRVNYQADGRRSPWSATLTASTQAAGPYFTAQWPVFTFANVAPAATEGDVTVRLRWTSVEGANGYKVVKRLASDTASSDAPGEVLFDAREYVETLADTGERVEYQVQGFLSGGTGGITVEIGGREVVVAVDEIKNGPFGDAVILLLTAETIDPFGSEGPLPPDAEGIPPVQEFATAIGETMAIEPERMASWTVLIWFIFSAAVAVASMAMIAASNSGDFVNPWSMGSGMLVMALLWGFAGPVWAGVPWPMALTPLALMVVSGIILARTRGVLP